MKEIEFKYIDIEIPKTEAKKDTFVFNVASALRNLESADEIGPGDRRYIANSNNFYGQLRENNNFIGYKNLANENYVCNESNLLFFKYSPLDVIDLLRTNKHVISVKPNEEATKAVEAILSSITDDRPIYIGQMYFKPDLNFAGHSIFCDNNYVAYRHDVEDEIISTKLLGGRNYKSIFKKPLTDVRLTRKNFSKIVDSAGSMAIAHGVNFITQDRSKIKGDLDSYKTIIKSNAKDFVTFKRKKARVLTYVKDMPAEVAEMCHAGINLQDQEFEETRDSITAYTDTFNLYKEAVGNEKHYKECLKEAGKDFRTVKELIKDGVIESINYTKKDGLHWTYPPMTYNAGSSYPAVFLGRMRVALHEKSGTGFRVHFMSFKPIPGVSTGTWHISNKLDGENHCLGGFKKILCQLAAKRQIAQLIHVFKEYILSADMGARLHNPDFSRFVEKNVIDDSWKVYYSKIKGDKVNEVHDPIAEVPF